MTIVEENTELFYEELNGNCNEKILLQLAKKGIFLYEPLFKHDKLKNHDYLVDISILARQYFMINTNSQYNHYFEIIESFDKYNIFSLYNNKYDCSKLIIINKFFMNKLINEENDKYISFIINSLHNNTLILKNLYKYKYITNNVYYLFIQVYTKMSKITFEIFDYFYFNRNNNIFNNYLLTYSFDKIFKIIYSIIEIGYDENMLKYCSDLLEKYNIKIPSHINHKFDFSPNFPLNILQKYSNKIYMPKKYIVEHEDKYFEKFINVLFSEKYLCYEINNPEYLFDFIGNDVLIKRYGFNINELKQMKYKIKYPENINYNNLHYIIMHNFKFLKYKNSKSKKEKLFSKHILNNSKEVQKLLDDINYIFTLDINFNKEIFLIQISYIISLIHNKNNKFIIKYLLSFIKVDENIITYENNKIIFYHKDFVFDEKKFIDVLLNVPNNVFKNYIELKELEELPRYGFDDNCSFIFNMDIA